MTEGVVCPDHVASSLESEAWSGWKLGEIAVLHQLAVNEAECNLVSLLQLALLW